VKVTILRGAGQGMVDQQHVFVIHCEAPFTGFICQSRNRLSPISRRRPSGGDKRGARAPRRMTAV
jgi:hypothetical protein